MTRGSTSLGPASTRSSFAYAGCWHSNHLVTVWKWKPEHFSQLKGRSKFTISPIVPTNLMYLVKWDLFGLKLDLVFWHRIQKVFSKIPPNVFFIQLKNLPKTESFRERGAPRFCSRCRELLWPSNLPTWRSLQISFFWFWCEAAAAYQRKRQKRQQLQNKFKYCSNADYERWTQNSSQLVVLFSSF